MPKIVQIQISNESAARSAIRLHNEFLKTNVQSTVISLETGQQQLGVIYLQRNQRIIAKSDAKLRPLFLKGLQQEFGMFSYPILGSDVSTLPEIRNADFIYIHWTLNGFLNFRSFNKIAKLKKPVIFVMHDMWNITGGCHHSFTCDKYQTGCYNCQMFLGEKTKDIAYKGFKKKSKFYLKYDNLFFISPSKWLFECAKKSLLTKDKPVYYIPNIIDNTLFKPFEKKTARKILNIDENETIIAFGAVSVSSPYKGWKYLQKALEILYKEESYKNITLLIFGNMNPDINSFGIPFKTKFMGYLNDEYSTMIVYNAANVFILPSVADNLPTTVQECLSCGTPVVGFNVGGVPDMIKHKANGYLAEYKNSSDISEGVKFCLKNNLKGYMLPEFNPDVIIKKHLSLFNEINRD